MTINDQGRRGAAVTSDDQIGKVFVAVGQDERNCLICDCLFTRQGAAEHAGTVCTPEMQELPVGKYGGILSATAVA
jgi:hypothetical protein